MREIKKRKDAMDAMCETEIRKDELRKKYAQIRRAIPAALKKEYDGKIFSYTTKHERYKSCEILLSYVSTEHEADTSAIITLALNEGKTAAVPKTRGNGDMDFYVIRCLSDLRRGRFGIMEPDDGCLPLEKYSNAVCIVPALAYSHNGRRIGYGGGYYDRFLSKHRDLYRVGLAYEACIAEELPFASHDAAVNIIITERGILLNGNQE